VSNVTLLRQLDHLAHGLECRVERKSDGRVIVCGKRSVMTSALHPLAALRWLEHHKQKWAETRAREKAQL